MQETTTLSGKLMQLIDAMLILLSFYLATLVRNPLIELFNINIQPKEVLNEQWWMLVIAFILMPFLLRRFSFYSGELIKPLSVTLWQLFRSCLLLAGVIGMMVVFLQLDPSSRLSTGTAFLLMSGSLLIRDRCWRNYRRRLAKQDRYKERVIIAGSAEDIEELKKEAPRDFRDFWNVVGEFDFQSHEVDDLNDLIKEVSAQRVIFSASHTGFDRLARAIEVCELQGVEAWVHAGFIRTQLARPDFDVLGKKPMLVLRTTPALSWALFFKEMMDRIGAFFLILFTLPIWIFAWIGIKITSPTAPVMFIQDRAGRFGRPFRMYKFRTMIPDAETKLKEVKKDVGNQMEGPVFKLDQDPRVFKFGSFLRKTSIDELPQLLNVLLGDMSLVGPRPLPVYEVKEFQKARHRRRLSVKPGITCTWQAGGRNTITSFEEWVDMDLAYIDSWSFWRDIVILIRTVPAVLLSRGAK